MEQNYKSSYFLRLLAGDYHPFTPNRVTVNKNEFELKRRNAHLFSVDTENLHFQNIIGISVDKHLFGATLKIVSKGRSSIKVEGLWKKKANELKAICTKRIAENTHKGTAEAMRADISSAIKRASVPSEANLAANPISGFIIADELKKLKELEDNGIISHEEFIAQKQKLM